MAKPPDTSTSAISVGEKQILTAVSGVSAQVSDLAAVAYPEVDLTPVMVAIASVSNKIDQVLVILNNGVVPVPPPVSDWPISPQPAAGTTATVSAGIKTGSMHIENADVTLGAAGMRKTIIDMQGGTDAGHREAWGKGAIHVNQNATIKGFGVVGNFNPNGKSDGEAGVYNEGGILGVQLCSFDSCENGCFMQPREFMAAGVRGFVNIDKCVYGRVAANGNNDGNSHDVYLGGDGAMISNSVFAGTSRGNTVKLRGNKLLLAGNFIGRTNGRWVDLPGGTDFDSSKNTYQTMPGAVSNNAMGLFDESDIKNTDRPGYLRSVDDIFVFARAREVIWVNRAQEISFVRPTVHWYGKAGDTPPTVIFSTDPGGDVPYTGLITGRAAFVCNEANRIDAPLPVPPDPA